MAKLCNVPLHRCISFRYNLNSYGLIKHVLKGDLIECVESKHSPLVNVMDPFQIKKYNKQHEYSKLTANAFPPVMKRLLRMCTPDLTWAVDGMDDFVAAGTTFLFWAANLYIRLSGTVLTLNLQKF